MPANHLVDFTGPDLGIKGRLFTRFVNLKDRYLVANTHATDLFYVYPDPVSLK